MPPPRPATKLPNRLRAALTAAALAGAAALAAATATTVIQITVGTTTRLASIDTELSGWDRHGPALLAIAALAAVMTLGALRGARPAMAAVAVCGAAALVVALAFDAPHLGDTGVVGELYTDASAGPRVGFWLEASGGLLLAGAGTALLVVTRGRERVPGAARARREAAPESR
jgi:hypothetical protein